MGEATRRAKLPRMAPRSNTPKDAPLPRPASRSNPVTGNKSEMGNAVSAKRVRASEVGELNAAAPRRGRDTAATLPPQPSPNQGAM
jgi:hypothetical protein